jgi:hypothetical protein
MRYSESVKRGTGSNLARAFINKIRMALGPMKHNPVQLAKED